jgi:AraC-like DNA-binding protein
MINQLNTYPFCTCCNNDEDALIKIYTVGAGESDEKTLLHNEIVLILEGSFSFALYQDVEGEESINGSVEAGNMMFFPIGSQLKYTATSNSKSLAIQLLTDVRACQNFTIEQLYHEVSDVEKQQNIEILPMNSRLQHFAEGVINAWNDGVRCTYYFEAEITKLQIKILSYYSKEELYRFFYPILSSNSTFSEYVKRNWRKYGTIGRLSESMNMTPPQFTKQFIPIFKQTPREWVQKEKAYLIYREIRQHNKQFKQIAHEFGFTDQSNFNRFCVKHFNKTPKELRRMG